MKTMSSMAAKLLGAALIMMGTLMAPAAKADLIIQFNTNNWFGDVTPPLSGTNFAEARFINAGTEAGQNVVLLTLDYFGTLPGDDGNALISEWSFNFTNVATVPLTISHFSGQGTSVVPQVSSNAFKADGTGGFFDILFDFHDGGPLTEQHQGEAIFKILGTGIDASHFADLSFDGRPSWMGAIHVQSWGDNGESLWIGGTPCTGPECVPQVCPPPTVGTFPDCRIPPNEAPEPGTIAILGAGLLGLAFARRRRVR